MFATGSGARLISSEYDHIATESDSFIASSLDRDGILVKAVSEDSLRYEILDRETGHSIATRTVDDEQIFNFNNYKIRVAGKTALNDQFSLQRTDSGAGDARNLDIMISNNQEI